MAAIMAAMRMKTRIAPLACLLCLSCAFMVAAPLAAQRPERPILAVSGYVIDAEIDTARTIWLPRWWSALPPEYTEAASFGLHPALKVTKISDEAGSVLTGQRSADAASASPGNAFCARANGALDLEYEGGLTGKDDGPIEGPAEGLKLAAIQEPSPTCFTRRAGFPFLETRPAI